MSDNLAIAQAIIARFASGVTPPSGLGPIVEATEQLPTGIAGLPAIYVFPPSEPDIEHPGAQTRYKVQLYPLRFYFVAEPSSGPDLTNLYGWHKALQDQILTQYQLGLAGTVAVARISSISPGVLRYAGQDYLGLDMVVSVTVSEPISPVA